MATINITESELANDIRAFIDQVQAGAEIVIERDKHPLAVIRAPAPRRRKLLEIAESLREDSTSTLDPDFAADVQDFIDSNREPLAAPDWD